MHLNKLVTNHLLKEKLAENNKTNLEKVLW